MFSILFGIEFAKMFVFHSEKSIFLKIIDFFFFLEHFRPGLGELAGPGAWSLELLFLNLEIPLRSGYFSF